MGVNERRGPRLRRPDAEHPAAGDGEALRPGLIAQPVNAFSSMAYPIAGYWRYRRLVRAGDRSPAGRVLVVAMAVNGLGSMGFHGPGDRVSERIHDLSLSAIVAIVTGDLVVIAVRRPVELTRRAGPAAILGAGALLNRLGRTGGPWHRPKSRLQPHAGWHLLSATSLALWPLHPARMLR